MFNLDRSDVSAFTKGNLPNVTNFHAALEGEQVNFHLEHIDEHHVAKSNTHRECGWRALRCDAASVVRLPSKSSVEEIHLGMVHGREAGTAQRCEVREIPTTTITKLELIDAYTMYR